MIVILDEESGVYSIGSNLDAAIKDMKDVVGDFPDLTKVRVIEGVEKKFVLADKNQKK